MPDPSLRIEKSVYGGDGLGRIDEDQAVLIPFTLPGELVQWDASAASGDGPHVLESSPDRVEPRCIHFGVCGGCQYQMANYPYQLRMKTDILRETLERAEVSFPVAIQAVPSPEPWGYRNRVRFRVKVEQGVLRFGYNLRGSNAFLAVSMCPITVPVLWSAAERLLGIVARDGALTEWLAASSQIELSCDDTGTRLQLHLLCAGPVPQGGKSFDRLGQAVKAEGIPLVSMQASRFHAPSGRATTTLATWGSGGLSYQVNEDRFWLTPGGFFQVNRFLLPAMVHLVCAARGGTLAWDLFAGVGLFSRRLARQFQALTAVEANPVAVEQLRRGLRPGDLALAETTLAFLRRSVLERDRPELIVLDPPRAGLGEEAAALLLRLAPACIVYVSCDPTTLARDLRVLTAETYRIAEAHLLDLFPQTYHLESVMVLERHDVQA